MTSIADILRSLRCQCGYPDWPGSCPGPHSCPVANYGCGDEDEGEADDLAPDWEAE